MAFCIHLMRKHFVCLYYMYMNLHIKIYLDINEYSNLKIIIFISIMSIPEQFLI